MKKSPDMSKFLKVLLQIYPLDTESRSRIKMDMHRTPTVEPLSKLFDNNQRAFFDASHMEDDSYKYFKNVFPKIAQAVSAQEWKDGKTEQNIKIKKIIQDHYTGSGLNKTQKNEFFDKYIKAPYEECIAKKTSNNSDIQLLISRNPMDMFFCSASLSFSSCMDVVKPNGFAFAYGLINTIPNPGQFLVAKVRGWQYVMYGGELFKIPNIISRAFAFISEDQKSFKVINWYNGQAISSDALGKLLNLEPKESLVGNKFVPYSLKFGSAHGKITPFQYADSGGIELTQDRKYGYYSAGGRSGNMLNTYVKLPSGTFDRAEQSVLKDNIKHNPKIDPKSIMAMFAKRNVTCHDCGATFQWDSYSEGNYKHECDLNVKNVQKQTWFGMTEEKVYPILTEQKKTIYFPQSEVLKFLKRKDIYIRKNKLVLKGVA